MTNLGVPHVSVAPAQPPSHSSHEKHVCFSIARTRGHRPQLVRGHAYKSPPVYGPQSFISDVQTQGKSRGKRGGVHECAVHSVPHCPPYPQPSNYRHTTRCGSSTKPVAPSCYSLGHAQARLVTAWPAPSWHQPNHSAPTRERSKRTPCDIYDFLAFFFLFFFACFFYRGRSLSSGVRTGVGAAEGR